MLRGLQRGQDWQVVYLTACMVQFAVEVIFYETSECAIIHYVIPDLARNEVHSVKFLLHRAIESLWADVPGSELVLNAPEYLFVSTQLANAFPSLLESMVVRSYFSSSPGELSKKWRISHFSASSPLSRWSWSRSRVRRFTVTALTTMIMQYLGAFSPTFQRVLIHSLQPLVLSGMYFVFDLLVRHPLYFIPLVALVVFVVYRVVVEEYHRRGTGSEDARKEIHPIPDPPLDEAPAASVAADVDLGSGGRESKQCEVDSLFKEGEQKEVEVGSGVWATGDHYEPNFSSSESGSESESAEKSWLSSSHGVGHGPLAKRNERRKPRGYSEDSALSESDISDNFSSLDDAVADDAMAESEHSDLSEGEGRDSDSLSLSISPAPSVSLSSDESRQQSVSGSSFSRLSDVSDDSSSDL
jgi:hypothetical protein